MFDALDERTGETLAAVQSFTEEVQDGLGAISAGTLIEMRAWIEDMRRALDRLNYALEVSLPLAHLQDQIAVQESADRLRAERDRVASHEDAASKTGSPGGKEQQP